MPLSAVPEEARVITISSSAIFEAVAVKVIVVPEFSATEVAEVVRVMDGYVVGCTFEPPPPPPQADKKENVINKNINL